MPLPLFGLTMSVSPAEIAVHWPFGGVDSHVHASSDGKNGSRFSGFFVSWSTHFLRHVGQLLSLVACPCMPHGVHVIFIDSQSEALWFSLDLAQTSYQFYLWHLRHLTSSHLHFNTETVLLQMTSPFRIALFMLSGLAKVMIVCPTDWLGLHHSGALACLHLLMDCSIRLLDSIISLI